MGVVFRGRVRAGRLVKARRRALALSEVWTEHVHIPPGISHTRQPAGSGAIRISPKARRLAADHGIDLAALTGSGPDGEILAEDVEAAIVNRR